MLRLVQSAVMKVYRFFFLADDIKVNLARRSKELQGKNLKKTRMEVEDEGLKLSVTVGGKEGESKAIVLWMSLEEKFHPLTRHICVVQFVHKRGTHTQRAWLKNCIVIFVRQKKCCHLV